MTPEQIADLTPASEKLLRDFDQYPDAIDASELSARLWMIEREARRAHLDILATAVGRLDEASEGRGEWLLGWQGACAAVLDILEEHR